MRGMQRSSKITSGRRSTSSMTGMRVAKASSMAEVSSPSACRSEPLIEVEIDARCNAFTAFGEA